MKAKIQLYTIWCLMFILSETILYSQTCTQCDNTGNPPGSFASEIGQNTTASGSYSFAGGINSSATELASFAFGANAMASDVYAISLGAMTTADNSNSFALGSFCKASGTSSFVLGNGPNSASILTNPFGYSLMIGFNSDKPTLFVGPSGGNGSTGKVGIGDVTNPQSKLHIKADNLEAAEVFIEPYLFGGSNAATIWLGTKQYGVRATYGKLEFKTGDNGRYVFNEGNVGIGTTNPTQKLQVIGNIMTSGFIMTGGAAAGKVLTSDASGQAAWTDSQWTTSGNNIYRQNGNVGIGTQSPPQARLHINGDLKLLSENPTYQFQILSNGQVPERRGISLTNDPIGTFNFYIHGWQTNAAFNFINGENENNLMKIDKHGRVGIGTTNTSDAKLTVAGRILAEEMKIILSVPQSDFVFEEDYELMPLPELDQFVRTNKHLPGVPSATEFAHDGYSVGEMDDLLLRKVEELTLYIIELRKELAEMKNKMESISQ